MALSVAQFVRKWKLQRRAKYHFFSFEQNIEREFWFLSEQSSYVCFEHVFLDQFPTELC